MRIELYALLLNNLKQIYTRNTKRAYLTRAQAYTQLKKHTGQDFGYDDVAWKNWRIQNNHLMERLFILENHLGYLPDNDADSKNDNNSSENE